MMAPLSIEEDNYIRLALLLKGVSPRAVRTYFDREFPPSYLPSTLNTNYNTLNGLKLNRVLNQAQWNLLFPRNVVPDSQSFDVTLMICLIRNLTMVTHPINGFDTLPLHRETTPGPDLARIKWFRNKLAHHDSNTIDTVYFNTAWTIISDAISRLGGQQMKQECQELKVKTLDQSNQEIMLEIKQSQEKIQELSENLSKLQTDHSKVTENMKELQDSYSTLQTEHSKVTEILSDTIPWNIRGQIKDELESWKENDKMFIETNGAKRLLKYIIDNGCVVVTGSPGTGKSSLVRHVALKMQIEGYDIVPVSNPKEIIKWYNPNKEILFVMDDLCGTYTLDPIKFENWKNVMEKIKALVEKKQIILIMSCRLHVYKDELMKSLSFYQSCECNILSAGMCLSKKEKQSIAELYLKSNTSKVSKYFDMFDCFPLLCQLYSKNPNLDIINLFTNPYTVYKDEIDKLKTDGAHVKYCALALCVMFNNHLKEEWLVNDMDKDIKTIIKSTYEACKVAKGTSRLVIRDELDSLTDTFIIKDDDVYRTIHDKLFDFCAFYFGNVMIHCLIDNTSSSFIRERFLFKNKNKSDEYIITVPEGYQDTYIKRMIKDWSRGNVVDVFCNINMGDQIFRRRFFLHIKDLEISQQKTLASLYDTNDNSNPLIQCSSIGDVDLVTWCLHHCINNVNHYRKDEVSPVFNACQNGHTKVVQILINFKADIHKRNDNGSSPLLMACQNGHIEVVQMLIYNKADINQCNYYGSSPLFLACLNGHIEVVQMLISLKTDINQCNNQGRSPLSMACHDGHTEVAQMLINCKADINLCNYNGSSPLFLACQNGHINIVKMLISLNADIDKCGNNGSSLLLIACENGHTKVVQMLLNLKADINQRNNQGRSPLSMACQNGHTEVVQMLKKYNADINLCNYNGSSPLFLACQNGHTEVVQMLIGLNADIDKCGKNGSSLLLIVCEKGHTELVQMLINLKADINKCNDQGSTPLLMACQNGHTEVVQMLINYKADINLCAYNESSPLFLACQNGHIKIVKMLISSNADIDKCGNNGSSLLLIACENGHTKVVQMLINYIADINQRNNKGSTPLSMACQNGHTEVVQMLINYNADINLCNHNGSSPLFLACLKGHVEVVQMLIHNKADINQCNYNGSSPLSIAYQNGYSEVVQILLNLMSDINATT